MSARHIFRLMSFPAITLALVLTPAHDGTACGRHTKHPNEQVLRQSRLFDLQKNSVSNVEFYTTNYGVFGLNADFNAPGGFWPRGSKNQYIFGGGIWFGAMKRIGAELNKLVVMSYNPNTGNSWFVPGRIADENRVDVSFEAIRKYGVYFSTDYTAEGIANDGSGRSNWPIWHTQAEETPGSGGYTGDYVVDPARRTMSVYPKGPVMYSDEDIVSIYKDTDLDYYEGDTAQARQQGYPLGIEVVQTLYTWGSGDLKDVVIMQYELTNRSQDTLLDCWFAPMMDFDILDAPRVQNWGDLDFARYYAEDTLLDLGVQWTSGTQGEAGMGFGYVGVSFLSSPAVSIEKFLRTDKQFYPREEQLGLQTFRNWTIDETPLTGNTRYDFISSGARDGDNGWGDRRFLMATGAFHMLPGQEIKVAVALVFARGSKGGEADGTTEDLAALAELTRKARQKYEESMHTGVVGVEEQTPSGNPLMTLGNFTPNPVSDRTCLELHLLHNASVLIEIADITGRTLLSAERKVDKGSHIVELDASTLPQGVYLCRVTANGVLQSALLSVVR